MMFIVFFFFFKQKTAYEMRISDWSSDVCSSDLLRATDHAKHHTPVLCWRQFAFYGLEQHHTAQRHSQAQQQHNSAVAQGTRQAVAIAIGQGVQQTFDKEIEDRKSTRLNSSH